ncbi:MAG: serine protein kinase RIO [Promethearchaeati archaeon SRVP18_Atabeyarchaeia-1]
MVGDALENLERNRIDARNFRVKRSEDLKTIEGVIDQSTMLALYSLMNKNIIKVIHGVVATGKESNVYWAQDGAGKSAALKIYRTSTADFRRMREYVMGDPRFERIKRGTRSLIFTWAEKEFKNLMIAQEAGVRVPRPIAVEKNVLVMEFIGKEGTPAPRMKDKPPSNPSATFKKILRYVDLLYKKGKIVHADLSEYNVLMWKGPVIIDVSQAVHTSHPASKEYLQRDLRNTIKYFTSLGVSTKSIPLIYEDITGEKMENYG